MSVATVATRLLKRSRSLHDDVDVCIKDRRDQRHEVNLVFIGDSIGYRSYWAATCSLLAHGAREVLPRHDDALYQQVHRHRNFSALRQHIINQSLATHNSTVQLSNLEPLASQQFELDLDERLTAKGRGHASRSDGSSGGSNSSLLVRVLGIWRAGSVRQGPGIVGEAAMSHAALSVFEQTMDSFGPCTAVMYNEGLHHHPDAAPHFRESLRFALHRLGRAAARNRVHVSLREMTAQHFDAGLDEEHSRAGLAGSYDASPPEVLNHTAKARCIGPGSPSLTSPWPASSNHDWHNTILQQAASEAALEWPHHAHQRDTATKAAELHGISHTQRLQQPAFLRFHDYTLAWRGTLFQGIDCTHTTCYTPFYWMPLWHNWAAALGADRPTEQAVDAGRGGPMVGPTQGEAYGLREALNGTVRQDI